MAFQATGISDKRLKEILHGVKVHCLGPKGKDDRKRGTLEVEGKKINVRCGKNEVYSLTNFCVSFYPGPRRFTETCRCNIFCMRARNVAI